jgi:hypothetical protein
VGSILPEIASLALLALRNARFSRPATQGRGKAWATATDRRRTMARLPSENSELAVNSKLQLLADEAIYRLNLKPIVG